MTENAVHVESGEIDPRQLRNALGRFPTGVTVITTCAASGKLEGLTANSFAALSLDPPLVLWSLVRKSLSLTNFCESGAFVINILDTSQVPVSHQFATPSENKYEGIQWEPGIKGCPLIENALATFECETQSTLDAGDHVLFIGRVTRLSYRDGKPLIFSGGQYATSLPLYKGHAESDLDVIWSGLG